MRKAIAHEGGQLAVFKLSALLSNGSVAAKSDLPYTPPLVTDI